MSGAPGARPGMVRLGVPAFVFERGPEALCRADPEAYFASGVRSSQAGALCAGCAYLEACRAYALGKASLHGVWGGLTRMQRDAVRRRQRGAVGELPPAS